LIRFLFSACPAFGEAVTNAVWQFFKFSACRALRDAVTKAVGLFLSFSGCRAQGAIVTLIVSMRFQLVERLVTPSLTLFDCFVYVSCFHLVERLVTPSPEPFDCVLLSFGLSSPRDAVAKLFYCCFFTFGLSCAY